ncbi:hypothetical protein HN777_04940 [Candidatus Woesearchaeota archaeon]|jgi:hypothetical protein|nr:hypothetical protein [Candidatus Woesearchaeota archaeon]MBT7403107.1 hypothetical protein [Candidatus Woesearchaeota archaeon]
MIENKTKKEMIDRLEALLDMEKLGIEIVRKRFNSENLSKNETYLGVYGEVGFTVDMKSGENTKYRLYLPNPKFEEEYCSTGVGLDYELGDLD